MGSPWPYRLHVSSPKLEIGFQLNVVGYWDVHRPPYAIGQICLVRCGSLQLLCPIVEPYTYNRLIINILGQATKYRFHSYYFYLKYFSSFHFLTKWKHDYLLCPIWGSQSGGYEVCYFLGYNAVQSVERQPMFRRKISPPSSGSKKPSKKPALFATYFHAGFLLGLFFDPEDGGDMFLRSVMVMQRGKRCFALSHLSTPVLG
jgi:hypothetical protein